MASGLAVSDVLPNTAPNVTNRIAEECCDHGNDCAMLITALTDDIIWSMRDCRDDSVGSGEVVITDISHKPLPGKNSSEPPYMASLNS